MISNTGPVTPAVPAERSILGILTSADSTSSFADQLASVVSGSSSKSQPSAEFPTKLSGEQRQNSDTPKLSLRNPGSPVPAGTPASASDSSAVQYSFFQYLMDTPAPMATALPTAASSGSTPSAQGIQPSSAQDGMSIADPGWLSPPYYTPPPAVFVSWENPPGVINTTASPESDLQNLAAQYLNDPLQFGWGSVPANTPQGFINNFVSYAQSRAAAYPKTCPAGYDPVATGTKYANLVLDAIKRIQYDTIGSSPYASVYDAWVAGVNTWPGASGTASAG
jgi:hypothetical protein